MFYNWHLLSFSLRETIRKERTLGPKGDSEDWHLLGSTVSNHLNPTQPVSPGQALPLLYKLLASPQLTVIISTPKTWLNRTLGAFISKTDTYLFTSLTWRLTKPGPPRQDVPPIFVCLFVLNGKFICSVHQTPILLSQ